jgi:malate permease and related proteins
MHSCRFRPTSVNNIALLVICFGLGIALRLSGRLPAGAPAALNGFIVNVALPALTIVTIQGLSLQPQIALAALMPWMLFAMGLAFFWGLGRMLKLSRSTTGALMLTGGLANTSFVGLPMIETWYGREYMGVGIVIDQLGSYLVLSTVGILVAGICRDAGASVNWRTVARKIAGFAPFVALIVAFALRPFDLPGDMVAILRRLADTLVPLALVSVGFQLRLSQIRGRIPVLALGLGFKLVLGPALVLLVLAGLLGQTGAVIRVTVFEAAMGSMIGAAIVAMDHDLDPSLVTLMVGLGIPLSFLTLPCWWWLLERVA